MRQDASALAALAGATALCYALMAYRPASVPSRAQRIARPAVSCCTLEVPALCPAAAPCRSRDGRLLITIPIVYAAPHSAGSDSGGHP